jgi:hypothetical protein
MAMINAGRRLLVAGELDGALLVDMEGSSPLLVGVGGIGDDQP